MSCGANDPPPLLAELQVKLSDLHSPVMSGELELKITKQLAAKKPKQQQEWQKYRMVLHGEMLYYYALEDLDLPRGVLYLNGCSIGSLTTMCRMSSNFYNFQLISRVGRIFMFRTESIAQRSQWISALPCNMKDMVKSPTVMASMSPLSPPLLAINQPDVMLQQIQQTQQQLQQLQQHQRHVETPSPTLTAKVFHQTDDEIMRRHQVMDSELHTTFIMPQSGDGGEHNIEGVQVDLSNKGARTSSCSSVSSASSVVLNNRRGSAPSSLNANEHADYIKKKSIVLAENARSLQKSFASSCSPCSPSATRSSAEEITRATADDNKMKINISSINNCSSISSNKSSSSSSSSTLGDGSFRDSSTSSCWSGTNSIDSNWSVYLLESQARELAEMVKELRRGTSNSLGSFDETNPKVVLSNASTSSENSEYDETVSSPDKIEGLEKVFQDYASLENGRGDDDGVLTHIQAKIKDRGKTKEKFQLMDLGDSITSGYHQSLAKKEEVHEEVKMRKMSTSSSICSNTSSNSSPDCHHRVPSKKKKKSGGFFGDLFKKDVSDKSVGSDCADNLLQLKTSCGSSSPSDPTAPLTLSGLLVEDNLEFLSCLLSVVKRDEKISLTIPLLRVFGSLNRLFHLLTWAIDMEIQSSLTVATLFRSEDYGSRFLSAFSRASGLVFIQKSLGPHIRSLLSRSVEEFELDPNKNSLLKTDPNLVIQNATNLMNVCQDIIDSIIANIDEIPPSFAHICAYLKNSLLSRFVKSANLKKSSEAKAVMGGFLFLRFICPAVTAPHVYGIVPKIPESSHRRILVLVTKLLFNTSTAVEFGVKEPYMLVANPFVTANATQIENFYSNVIAKSSIITEPTEIEQLFTINAMKSFDITDSKVVEKDMILVRDIMKDNVELIEAKYGDENPVLLSKIRQTIQCKISAPTWPKTKKTTTAPFFFKSWRKF